MRHHRGDVRIAVRRRDLEPDPPVVGHRLQVVDRVQLTARVGRVVHAGHAAAELEPQVRVVAQVPDQLDQVLAGHVEGDLAAVDDHLGDHVGVVRDQLADPARTPRPTSRRTAAWRRRELDRPGQPAVAGGVPGAAVRRTCPCGSRSTSAVGSGTATSAWPVSAAARSASESPTRPRAPAPVSCSGLGPGVRLGLALRVGALDRRLGVGLGVERLVVELGVAGRAVGPSVTAAGPSARSAPAPPAAAARPPRRRRWRSARSGCAAPSPAA